MFGVLFFFIITSCFRFSFACLLGVFCVTCFFLALFSNCSIPLFFSLTASLSLSFFFAFLSQHLFISNASLLCFCVFVLLYLLYQNWTLYPSIPINDSFG